jgi:hypothetical protein
MCFPVHRITARSHLDRFLTETSAATDVAGLPRFIEHGRRTGIVDGRRCDHRRPPVRKKILRKLGCGPPHAADFVRVNT